MKKTGQDSFEYLSSYSGMSHFGGSEKWRELMNSLGNIYSQDEYTKVVKFRPDTQEPTEEPGDKAKRFKRLFA